MKERMGISKEEGKINVLIACADEKRRSVIKNFLADDSLFGHVKFVSDGKSTVDAIKENIYSSAVIYLGLLGNDGLWVLEELKKQKYSGTKIIAVNNFKNTSFSKLAVSAGADYCLTEPFDLDILKKRILQICGCMQERQKECSFTVRLSEIISRIGIRPGLKGYNYLKFAVPYVIENPNALSGITKSLYPEIAVKYKTQPKCVERNIRHCIDVSWQSAKEQYKNIFGYEFYKKPTNKELIYALAEYIKDMDLMGFSTAGLNIRRKRIINNMDSLADLSHNAMEI